MNARARGRLLALLASAAASACSRAHAPPRQFSDAEVQAALHRAPDIDRNAPCKFRRIGHARNTIIALCAPMTGTSTTIAGPDVVLAQARGKRLEVQASAQLVLSETHCNLRPGDFPPRGDPPSFELVSVAFEVARASHAIGVRFSCSNRAGGAEGTETRLYLLERSGTTLRQIFDQRTGGTRIDRANQRQSVTHGAVVKQATMHAGHYDLALETTTFETEYPAGSAESFDQQRDATQWFVFDGDRYVAARAK
jgi:hypothetical protein